VAVPGPQAPTGTVTFLFSDVVGSTRLWAKDPEAMSASLRIHDQTFVETIATFGGYVFANAGDSFAAAFARASSAVDCAEALQRALAEADWGMWPVLSVRIGLHVGEAEERDGSYFGLAVNRAARVMAVAHGGQCVLTDGVRDAAAMVTTDLGIHVLRDIETPVHLNQLGTESFPPLWSIGAGIVSLPLPRTSLIGRKEAVEEVRRILGAHRLVTLVGVGGCGKTRLAIEVAYREVPFHPGGVWFVDLSTVGDSVALPGAFSAALELSITPEPAPIDQIAAYLSPREALLLVDNCEQVVDAVAEFLDHLLARAPRIRVVATSRESLDVEGEFTWKVPSLGTGKGAPAVELFFERASAAGASLSLDEATTSTVIDIVEHLDGIPLAIELAAARTRSMELMEVRDRLDDRFQLLSGGSRRHRQRQVTLEGAVHWSYDLLSEPERSMLQTLSVFQGGFSVPDVAAVAGIPDYEAIDLIDSLEAKSLVDVSRDRNGHVRHRLLETIRLFALARLIDAGEAETTRDRHLEHFYNDPAGASLETFLSLDSVARAGREYENFRSAATWAIERGRPEATARIAAISHEAGARHGESQLVIDCLRLPAELAPRDRINVAMSLAYELLWLGDLGGSAEAVQIALSVNEEHPCDFAIWAMLVEGITLGILGEHRRMVERLEFARQVAQERYGPVVVAVLDFQLGWADVLMLRYAEAVERFHKASGVPNLGFLHLIEANRAWALLAAGHLDDAVAAVAAFSEIPDGSQWEHLNVVFSHAVMAHTVGPIDAARSLAREADELVARRPHISSTVVQGFAYLAHIRGDDERVREITSLTLPVHGEQLWNWLVLRPLGATAENFADVRSAYEKEHPLLERFVVDAEHGRRLLTEEIVRWS
jgi:predicted ATPase/class 3 adenylate cyclase